MRKGVLDPIKYLGVFILLTHLSCSAQALQCAELFANRDRPTHLRVQSTTEDKEVALYRAVTSNNIGEIFKHNYQRRDLRKFGAKAVVTSLPGQPTRVYFFPTGEGKQSWNIHHVDAITSALNESQSQSHLVNLPYIQGYEMTAQIINGKWAIIRLDIRSTLTYFHTKMPLRRPSREREEAMLRALISNIDEELQRFPLPSIEDIDE